MFCDTDTSTLFFLTFSSIGIQGHSLPPSPTNFLLRWESWKESLILRDTKVLFLGYVLKCSSTLRGTNSKTTHYHPVVCFSAQYPKRNCKAPAGNLLRLNTLKGIKTALILYDQHPHLHTGFSRPPHALLNESCDGKRIDRSCTERVILINGYNDISLFN